MLNKIDFKKNLLHQLSKIEETGNPHFDPKIAAETLSEGGMYIFNHVVLPWAYEKTISTDELDMGAFTMDDLDDVDEYCEEYLYDDKMKYMLRRFENDLKKCPAHAIEITYI